VGNVAILYRLIDHYLVTEVIEFSTNKNVSFYDIYQKPSRISIKYRNNIFTRKAINALRQLKLMKIFKVKIITKNNILAFTI